MSGVNDDTLGPAIADLAAACRAIAVALADEAPTTFTDDALYRAATALQKVLTAQLSAADHIRDGR